ncbi:hypothetical protein PHK61_19965 [Actinomycetospora lutea]|uniref:hypothetical protein n=1 Tax=Actinomycetospora lutea TaxID=663604 RepID=UPI002366728A|nr:hypothetical protein [Actinomycetospora lutea]MDD7940704.1 hypothetical protein [Actinomycetospora lutea]
MGLSLTAELGGDGFEPVAIGGTADRPTAPGDVAEWQWDVKATKPGFKVLTLTVRSYYGSNEAVAVRYINQSIQVDRDWGYTLTNLLGSPAWTATGLSVPVILGGIGGVWAFLRRRRKKQADSEPPQPPSPQPAEKAEQPPSTGYL